MGGGLARVASFRGGFGFRRVDNAHCYRSCVAQIRKGKSQAKCCEESDEDGIDGNRQVRTVPSNPSMRREPAELRQRMDQALGQLSHENRTVLVLHELEKMEYKEIARIMGCSIGAVTSKLLYARRKIAALLDN